MSPLFIASLLILTAHETPRAFSPKPWIEDLEVVRQAFVKKYANLEWLALERGVKLDETFADMKKALESAQGDAEARTIFDRFARRLGDAHVAFRWPSGKSSSDQKQKNVCASLGIGTQRQLPSIAEFAPGYEPVKREDTAEFPAGILRVNGQKVGVLRVGSFDLQLAGAVCEPALAALKIASDATCTDECEQRVIAWAYERMTHDLESQIAALRKAGATTLVVDITRNGGGSEWFEAVARMFTAKRLKPEAGAFVRGEHTAKSLAKSQTELSAKLADADAADKALLSRIIEETAAKEKDARTPCDGTPLLRGEHPSCEWLVARADPARESVAMMDPAVLQSKNWVPLVFAPMEYPYYREGVWNGPLIIVVDGGTASAAEGFAALLQDNKAAVIMGSPTMGAGCGYIDGGDPTELPHSKAILELPGCARIRLDGTNEVMGIQPDVLVGFRQADGPRRLSIRFADKLPDALRLAANGTKKPTKR